MASQIETFTMGVEEEYQIIQPVTQGTEFVFKRFAP
jgi:hypothetical protein